MADTSTRRARIVTAARPLLLRVGLRGTTMEEVARAAQIAKPTLYAYFPDKVALAEAVGAEVTAEIGLAVAAELNALGTIVQRVNRGLVELSRQQNLLLVEWPASVLLWRDETGRPTARMLALEQQVAEQISAVLATAAVERPRHTAQVLVAASAGVAARARHFSEVGPALRLLCEKMLATGRSA